MSNYTSVIKVTDYPPHLKHKTILETYASLQQSESMLIVNDHDPVPLRFQLESMHKENFEWNYIDQGPTTFQVKITKLNE